MAPFNNLEQFYLYYRNAQGQSVLLVQQNTIKSSTTLKTKPLSLSTTRYKATQKD